MRRSPFCLSALSRQAPKQLRLMAAQLAWTLFIRRGVGIHQAERAQIRGRAGFFFLLLAALGLPRRCLDDGSMLVLINTRACWC